MLSITFFTDSKKHNVQWFLHVLNLLNDDKENNKISKTWKVTNSTKDVIQKRNSRKNDIRKNFEAQS